jgi:predicted site-specific integrase-resolvase
MVLRDNSSQISFQNQIPVTQPFLRQGEPMKNYTFGYARVSTEQQNLDRQLDALQKYGVDKIYNEKMTGTKKDRPELSY